jgi:hypothetical protein
VIGVIAKDGQLPLVEEFFELFKTPWEICERGRKYDVVLATRDEGPLPEARLVVLFGSRPASRDMQLAVEPQGHHRTGALKHKIGDVPVYGDLLTFVPAATQQAWVTAHQGIAGVCVTRDSGLVLRVGYDLFEEVRFLLTVGQPADLAGTPTLDLHVDLLRSWILRAGIPFVEIPPVPDGHDFTVCLTHDIDFVGIRDHKFDHSMWGFLYRATLGSARNFVRGRLAFGRLLKSWAAAASLPFVYLGWSRDFWEPFGWYLTAEAALPATYYLIPFKRRAGEHVPGAAAGRRATAYDVTDIRDWAQRLVNEGCEVGVHGIDAWHDPVRGREEMARVSDVVGGASLGIRMHWLLEKPETPAVLEKAGYSYDSTGGYNETIGFRNGTSQVFRPIGARTLLELPMHIQDGALFYPQRLDLGERDAAVRCRQLVDSVAALGGIVTVLWHDRSHGPERFWGDFYVRLIETLKSARAWFATGSQAVRWFRSRRSIKFRRVDTGGTPGISIEYAGDPLSPPVRLRVYRPSENTGGSSAPAYSDTAWDGRVAQALDSTLRQSQVRGVQRSHAAAAI